jgi:hypothetical protein
MMTELQVRALEERYVGKKCRVVGPYAKPEWKGRRGTVVRLISAFNGDTIESEDEDLWVVRSEDGAESVCYGAELAEPDFALPLIPPQAFRDWSLYQ